MTFRVYECVNIYALVDGPAYIRYGLGGINYVYRCICKCMFVLAIANTLFCFQFLDVCYCFGVTC